MNSYRTGIPIIAVVLTCGCNTSVIRAADADLSDVPAMLDALEAAITSIHSFDLRVEENRKWFFEEYELVADGPQKVMKQRREAKVFSPPKSENQSTRQVFAKGSRRVEVFDSKTGQLKQVGGGDNERERVFFPKSLQGEVRRAGGQFLATGSDYLETFRDVGGTVPIMLILRERQKSLKIYRAGDGNRYIVFETDTAPRRAVSMGGYGYRIFADTSNSLMPAMVECYEIKGTETMLASRTTVTRRKLIAPGLEVPVASVKETFSQNKGLGKYQQANSAVELTVDESRSRWNHRVDGKEFRITFPTGTMVTDFERDMAIITGKPDPGDNLDDLVANAKHVIPGIRGHSIERSRAWMYWTAGGIGVVLLVGTGWLAYRRRSARSAS